MYEISYIETVALLVLMVLAFEIGEEMSSTISVNDYSWQQQDTCYCEIVI
jgi:hypothetical protein